MSVNFKTYWTHWSGAAIANRINVDQLFCIE